MIILLFFLLILQLFSFDLQTNTIMGIFIWFTEQSFRTRAKKHQPLGPLVSRYYIQAGGDRSEIFGKMDIKTS